MKKKIDIKPFDRYKIPPKQNIFAMPFIWLCCYFITRKSKLRINKVNMKGLKPPYLVFGTHQSFTDFLVTPLALFPRRANYVSELEGFECYGEWKYRQIGCLGTRKFINDIALVKNIKRIIDRKGIVVVYPEARYCNVGTGSKLTDSVGKLVKMLKVPVVVVSMRGNYLQSPIWNLTKRKEVMLDATITKVLSREDIEKKSNIEINDILQEYFNYDEYKYQYDTKMAITYDKRAEGLEVPLYKCPNCKEENAMITKGTRIYCKSCKKSWEMDEYGRIKAEDSITEFSHIPDWYEFERDEVIKEINNKVYNLEVKVHIEALPNAVNFIDLGEGILKHDEHGFTLNFKDYGDKEDKELHFEPITMSSVHTEYDYRGKGQCITLSTVDNTYFLFPLEDGFNATKIQFATEYLYYLAKGDKV